MGGGPFAERSRSLLGIGKFPRPSLFVLRSGLHGCGAVGFGFVATVTVGPTSLTFQCKGTCDFYSRVLVGVVFLVFVLSRYSLRYVQSFFFSSTKGTTIFRRFFGRISVRFFVDVYYRVPYLAFTVFVRYRTKVTFVRVASMNRWDAYSTGLRGITRVFAYVDLVRSGFVTDREGGEVFFPIVGTIGFYTSSSRCVRRSV